ncbi:hypothetical protein FE391_43785 [Nonomuraea sp. KC401]|uniref:hypothetical protein n=1 Tax=unclassified Nonomuraea TaxID=2593643 RepID=UPI0010FDABC7|nr:MULTISPECIES: hypothetical protein [unclassified Nonomuraea]NBE94321.1 hypothetical protein [Nonomuraea sp. K271]TLF52188.1 hypothetical protein FE391_43785 [Nonomuraea sp. KC401]
MPYRHHVRTILPLAALAVLCGCGGAAETAAPSPSATSDKKHRLEAAKADCMKQKGFKYVPFVSRRQKPDTDESRKRAAGDYQALRKYREKYGFGVFAMYVYPKEMGNPAVKPDNPEINPNWEIQSSLSKAQMGVYHEAQDACMVTAAGQVLGLKLKSGADYYAEQNKIRERELARAVNSDPALVELTGAMATCLKSKGHAISDTTPLAMAKRGPEMFRAQEDKLGREQRDDVPDVAPPAKEGELSMTYAPSLTPVEARPYLNRETKAALDDLECGKDFYPAYLPREQAIDKQVSDRFGM